MQSKARTVAAYLASLPEDRRRAVETVRKVILDNLDKNYAEGMDYGMIGYFVPHSVYPKGYHCNPEHPLPFAGLASQKQHLSLYLMGLYCGCLESNGATKHANWFHKAWAKTGCKIDCGKSCIRFKRAEDLPLDLIGEAIRRLPAKAYIAEYETFLATRPTKGAARKASPERKPAGRPAKSSSGVKTAKKPAKKARRG